VADKGSKRSARVTPHCAPREAIPARDVAAFGSGVRYRHSVPKVRRWPAGSRLVPVSCLSIERPGGLIC